MDTDSKYHNEYYDYVLKGTHPGSKAKKAVFDIIEDLTDRRGLRQEFERIDADIQDEIIDIWISLIDSAIK